VAWLALTAPAVIEEVRRPAPIVRIAAGPSGGFRARQRCAGWSRRLHSWGL